MTASLTTTRIRLDRRYVFRGLNAGFRWFRNPVSADGAKQVPRARIYLTGPEILKNVEAMRQHPVGARLLREKPDFGEASRLENLAKMPPGSFGHAWFEMMNQPGMAPGYLLAGLAYADSFLDTVDMDDDVRWLMDRQIFDHDASHILSGYGTDLASEALNIMFVQGLNEVPKWLAFGGPFGLVTFLILPSVGFRRWRRELRHAYQRGRDAAKRFPYHSYPYEELLPKPLPEVREYLGIDPLPEDFDTSHWLDNSRMAKKITGGYGTRDETKRNGALDQQIIESGIPWKDYMRATPELQQRLRAMAADGASEAEIRSVLGNTSVTNGEYCDPVV